LFSSLNCNLSFIAAFVHAIGLLFKTKKFTKLKKSFLVLLLFILGYSSKAQSDTISVEMAKNYIGKEVVLKGILKGIKPFKDRNDRDILFLDIDETYPNTQIGVTIFPDAVLEIKISKDDIGKTVFISGIVQDYKGKPSLPISEGKQIKIE
jgi:hypothetical protein